MLSESSLAHWAENELLTWMSQNGHASKSDYGYLKVPGVLVHGTRNFDGLQGNSDLSSLACNSSRKEALLAFLTCGFQASSGLFGLAQAEKSKMTNFRCHYLA